MSEQCGYIFAGTNNRCQLPKGHVQHSHQWYAMTMPQQEMTSLREIKDKLDALDAKVSTFEPAMGKQLADVAGELVRLADSQGKLLAILNEHGTAFDIVCESQGKLLAALNEIPALVFAEFQKRIQPSDARPVKPKRKRKR